MRRGRGMEAACARIGDVRLDGRDLQAAHEVLRRCVAALHAEGHDAAGAVRQVFLSEFIVFVAGQAAVAHPRDVVILL